ncbi:glycosyl transferase family protein [Xanthobacter sp. V4C-4]|uniref:glycosyl transferase family protein n=1 Tax=Xanthobacter cornucopiae TaxID=3119924 RepID=UPI003726637C
MHEIATPEPGGGGQGESTEERSPRPGGVDKLARGRLFLTLDALLATRSVTAAARQLGIQPSGVSRILADLRVLFDDPLLIRSGRGLVPSPKAEALHPQVQQIAAAIHALFEPDAPHAPKERFDARWNVPYQDAVPPLAVQPVAEDGGGGAAPGRRAGAAADLAPPQRLARLIGQVGGARKAPSQSLDMDEAEDALAIILAGAADPVQIGAFLSLVQARGTTAVELAGFVRAARLELKSRFKVPRGLSADLDWPCCISPRDQRPPWFLHAAQLVVRAGYRVVLHGTSGAGAVSGRHGVVAAALEIPTCTSGAQVARALDRRGIAYVPLAELSPQLFRLFGLYALTQNRSPAHDVAHLLQPVPARASLLGVTKPSYKELHRDTARLLGLTQLVIVGNTKDVAQLNPFRATTLHRLVDGEAQDDFVPSLPEPPSQGRLPVTSLEHWHAVWTGASVDPRARSIIIGTAAAALLALSRDPSATFAQAHTQAEALWQARHEGRPQSHMVRK